MLDIALEKAKSLKLNITYTCKVPGVFDMPVIVDTLLEKKNVDAVVTLGAVIKGQTKHDELIANVTYGLASGRPFTAGSWPSRPIRVAVAALFSPWRSKTTVAN